MKRFVSAVALLFFASAAFAIGLGGPMRNVNESGLRVWDEKEQAWVKVEPSTVKYVPFFDESCVGEPTRIRKEINGDIVVERYGDGCDHEVWKETFPGRWERWD